MGSTYRVRGRLPPLPRGRGGKRGPRARSPFVGDSGRTRGSAPTLDGRGRGGRGTPHQVPIRRGQRADTWVRPYARRSSRRGGKRDPAPGPHSSGTAGGHVGPPLRSTVEGESPSPPHRVRGRLGGRKGMGRAGFKPTPTLDGRGRGGKRGPRARSPFVGDSGRTRGSAPTDSPQDDMWVWYTLGCGMGVPVCGFLGMYEVVGTAGWGLFRRGRCACRRSARGGGARG